MNVSENVPIFQKKILGPDTPPTKIFYRTWLRPSNVALTPQYIWTLKKKRYVKILKICQNKAISRLLDNVQHVSGNICDPISCQESVLLMYRSHLNARKSCRNDATKSNRLKSDLNSLCWRYENIKFLCRKHLQKLLEKIELHVWCKDKVIHMLRVSDNMVFSFS